MQNSYSTIYLRSTFECSNKELINELTVLADYDDGFILWINGEVALSRNVPSVLEYNGFAPLNHESGIGEVFNVEALPLNLVDGINYIAVQGLLVIETNLIDFIALWTTYCVRIRPPSRSPADIGHRRGQSPLV